MGIVARRDELEKVFTKLSSLAETAIKQQATLEQLTRSVEVHVKRSDNLEAKLTPIERHVWAMELVLKVLGTGAILAPILRYVWKWTSA